MLAAIVFFFICAGIVWSLATEGKRKKKREERKKMANAEAKKVAEALGLDREVAEAEYEVIPDEFSELRRLATDLAIAKQGIIGSLCKPL